MLDPLRCSVRRRVSLAVLSTAIIAAPGITPIGLAHNVEMDGDVGATFHLEPDHNPKSGEPATVWFALTRDGGSMIPLSDCDCKLSIVNTQNEAETIESPSLTAIDVETYTDIPSAEVVFPEAGLYAVKLSGTSSATATEPFDAFELSYEVTVQPGTAKETAATTATSAPTASASPSPAATDTADQTGKMQRNPVVDSWIWLILSLLMLGAGGVLGLLALGGKSKIFLPERWKKSPRRSKTSRPTPSEPVTPSNPGTPSPSDTTPEAANTAVSATVTTSDLQATAPTSAIAAEAQPAPEASTSVMASDVSKSQESNRDATGS
jgi:hypothetical protein